eukprot:g81936.t1
MPATRAPCGPTCCVACGTSSFFLLVSVVWLSAVIWGVLPFANTAGAVIGNAVLGLILVVWLGVFTRSCCRDLCQMAALAVSVVSMLLWAQFWSLDQQYQYYLSDASVVQYAQGAYAGRASSFSFNDAFIPENMTYVVDNCASQNDNCASQNGEICTVATFPVFLQNSTNFMFLLYQYLPEPAWPPLDAQLSAQGAGPEVFAHSGFVRPFRNRLPEDVLTSLITDACLHYLSLLPQPSNSTTSHDYRNQCNSTYLETGNVVRLRERASVGAGWSYVAVLILAFSSCVCYYHQAYRNAERRRLAAQPSKPFVS